MFTTKKKMDLDSQLDNYYTERRHDREGLDKHGSRLQTDNNLGDDILIALA